MTPLQHKLSFLFLTPSKSYFYQTFENISPGPTSGFFPFHRRTPGAPGDTLRPSTPAGCPPVDPWLCTHVWHRMVPQAGLQVQGTSCDSIGSCQEGMSHSLATLPSQGVWEGPQAGGTPVLAQRELQAQLWSCCTPTLVPADPAVWGEFCFSLIAFCFIWFWFMMISLIVSYKSCCKLH